VALGASFPEVFDSVSHEPSSEAVQFNWPVPVFLIVSVCGVGFGPPCGTLKTNVVGVRVISGSASGAA
jgi:hypothetical protein